MEKVHNNYKKITIDYKTVFIFINNFKKDNNDLLNNIIKKNKNTTIININNYKDEKNSNCIKINENKIYNINIYKEYKNIKEKKICELKEYDKMIILFTSGNMKIISSYITNNLEILKLIT